MKNTEGCVFNSRVGEGIVGIVGYAQWFLWSVGWKTSGFLSYCFYSSLGEKAFREKWKII